MLSLFPYKYGRQRQCMVIHAWPCYATLLKEDYIWSHSERQEKGLHQLSMKASPLESMEMLGS